MNGDDYSYNDDLARAEFLGGFDDKPGSIPKRTWWQAFLLAFAIGALAGAVLVGLDLWCAGRV